MVSTLRVIVAPDSFKGSLSARSAADAIAEGWLSVRPGDEVLRIPLADGGEGTLDAVEAAVAGARRRDAGPVLGPDGSSVRGEWLELPDGSAVIELAMMAGLPQMRALDATGATTFGVGEVMRAALSAGATRLIVALGGSATTDGGAGALAALGLAATGGSLEGGGGGLGAIIGMDRTGLLAPSPGGILLLTDVDAPLLGPLGAAAVFGPQKGATPEQIELLDEALAHFAELLGGNPLEPGAGAAGGTAYGLAAALGAEITPGAAYIMALTGIDTKVRRADVVLTGEGRFDATSSGGKLVGELITAAAEGSAVIGVIAGVVAARPTAPGRSGIWSAELVDLAGSTEAAMADPIRWLRVAGAHAARALA